MHELFYCNSAGKKYKQVKICQQYGKLIAHSLCYFPYYLWLILIGANAVTNFFCFCLGILLRLDRQISLRLLWHVVIFQRSRYVSANTSLVMYEMSYFPYFCRKWQDVQIVIFYSGLSSYFTKKNCLSCKYVI
jgi:hypothetical protein